MSTSTQNQQGDPLLKVIAWFIALAIAAITLHFMAGCASPYPAQSKVLKQDTHRHNPTVGR